MWVFRHAVYKSKINIPPHTSKTECDALKRIICLWMAKPFKFDGIWKSVDTFKDIIY